MPRIGIVFAGAGSKGAYEIGCLRAIEDHFGCQSIKCISSASIGALITQAYGMGFLDVLVKKWREIDTEKHGKIFLSYSGNDDILQMISDTMRESKQIPFEHYVSIWNYTQHRSEYVSFHSLTGKELQDYMKGALSVPIFSKGEVVRGDRILDGAFLDNIPAYPLINKELDYIFCIYFDNYKYVFENRQFDKKIIKLFDFPNDKRLELFVFNKERFDQMVDYGYEYTKTVINKLFSNQNSDEVYRAIELYENDLKCEHKPRLTSDVVLNNINVMAKRYSKRLSNRTKIKDQ